MLAPADVQWIYCDHLISSIYRVQASVSDNVTTFALFLRVRLPLAGIIRSNSNSSLLVVVGQIILKQTDDLSCCSFIFLFISNTDVSILLNYTLANDPILLVSKKREWRLKIRTY